MITENITVDETAIQADIGSKTKLATDVVQREFDGIVRYADDLKAAMRIKYEYLAEHPGDLMDVNYGILFDRIEVTAYLRDFAVLPSMLHLFARVGYKRAEGYEEPQQTESGTLEVRYDIEDRSGAIDLELSPLAAEGAVCERVKTGERVTSTYGIRCHGETLAAT